MIIYIITIMQDIDIIHINIPIIHQAITLPFTILFLTIV